MQPSATDVPGAALESMSVKELRQLIDAAGLDHSDCVEKPQLQQRAWEAQVVLKR